jgi:hypothetical protein
MCATLGADELDRILEPDGGRRHRTNGAVGIVFGIAFCVGLSPP